MPLFEPAVAQEVSKFFNYIRKSLWATGNDRHDLGIPRRSC